VGTVFVLPGIAGPKQEGSSLTEALKQQAALGFDAPLYKELYSFRSALGPNQAEVALATIDKTLARHPDCLYLYVQKARLLLALNASRRSSAVLEKALKMAEATNDHYRELYDLLVKSYTQEKNSKGLTQLLEKMLAIFPHSRREILKQLAVAYRHSGDVEKVTQSLRQLQMLAEQASTSSSPLLAKQPSGKDRIPSGTGYEFTARTDAFPKFKLTLSENMWFGDTGTAQYVDLPPNYDQIVVVSPESHNCFKTPVNKMLTEFI
jgi:tetratricopeptide (TPR) repeat protein